MKKKSIQSIKFVLLILILAMFSHFNTYSQVYKSGVLQGTIRIKVKPEIITSIYGLETRTKSGIVVTGIKSLDQLSAKYTVTSIKRVFPYSPKFEERHMKHGLHLWYEVTYTNTTKSSSDDLVEIYKGLDVVDKAEVVHMPELIDGSGKPHYVSKSTLTDTRTSVMPFNDPYLKKQWHYNNYGQSGGTIGADINLFNGWSTTHGTPNVVIAIMDQGVDYKHEDLHNMMWVNEAELNGVKGVDDDGNGFKDDIYGVNFADNTGNLNIDYHGTHVAGTIAAQNDNGIGVCGVAGGSGIGDGVRIMSCQILGGPRAADIPGAYVYAADMGAVISQNSWGYQTPGTYDDAVNVGIDYFIAEAGNYPGSPMKGGVVIFASGNSNTELMMYPGAYQNVIGVDALNSISTRASYSNYGTWTDISAPGGDAMMDAELNAPAGYSNGIMSTLNANGYGYLDGTSMACPHVSGIAGLVVSQFGGPDFTNEMLKTHLLTGVRYLYGIPGNIQLTGKLGSGYIDAALALKKDNKIAPNSITDLAFTGMAQDFATITWSVPADEDDVAPLSFEIIYSKVEINAATIAQAKILNLSNIKNVGETQSYEITDLQSVTKYYFSVRGIDRWGNVSDFSNQIIGTTNSGPVTSFDAAKSALDIVINVAQNPLGGDSVKLINTGEGMLKWDVLSRVKTITPLSKRPNLQYPTSPNSYSPTYNILSNTVEPSILNSIQHDTVVDKGYVNEWVSLKVFGESNINLPNSSATRFYVNEEEGFNFTFTEAYLQLDTAKGPVIVEVYEGYDIADAKLLLAQEVKAPKPNGYMGVTLNEQIFFPKGSYFWVVYHIPAGNKYPLGGGLELGSEMSKNCYYSTNVGKTWKLFEDVYDDNRVVWAVFAMSLKQNVNDFIVLSPDSGVIASNQYNYISAKVDATKMINGSYKSSLVVNTNETGKPMLRLPINVTVTGHLPKIESLNRVDFGGVMIGTSKDVKVTVKNTGLGRFNFLSPYCNISNPQFTYIGGINTVFESGASEELTFRFTPNTAGNIYSYVTLLDANGHNYQFQLFGSAVEPPIVKLNPPTSTFNNLALGDSIVNSIYVKNTGKYPLDYFLPAYADGSNMETKPAKIQKFGYTFQVDTIGTTYVWNDIVSTGIDITDQFKGNTMTNIYSTKIDMGFVFPYYGKYENSIHISKYGLVAFQVDGAIWSANPAMYDNYTNPTKYISALGTPMQFYEAGFGKVYYRKEADKFIVQYEDAPYWDGNIWVTEDGENYTQIRASITFQIVLHDNGDINFYYKQNSYPDLWKWSLVAMEDRTNDDGILITGREWKKYNNWIVNTRYQAHSAVNIFNPGLGLFSNLSNTFGTVLPGDSAKIKYTIKTDSLNLLSYRENLVVVSNDPIHNPSFHAVDFTITSGGVSNVTSDTSEFNFGTTFKGGIKENSFILSNDGKAIDNVISATFDNGFYTIKGNIPEILKPNRQLTYIIAMKTGSIGLKNDVLRLTTANGQIITIALSGEVIQGPVIELQTSAGAALTSITKFITAGNSTSQAFKIKNSGAVNLNVAPVNNEWASIKETTTSANEFAYNYKWKSSKDFGGPIYDWVEIANNGGTKVTGLDSWAGPEWTSGIKLPFSFKFYENEYDTLYIGANGILTFTKGQDEYNYYFSVKGIPLKGIPNNYIAPLFLFGGPDWVVMYPLVGVYYKLEEDRVIIEYRDFNSAFTMGDPISYQAILYKNGNIKFQYVMPANTSNTVTDKGEIGIENIDGTDGVEISNNQTFVNSNMSIELYPVRTYSIAPNDSKDFIMDLTAKDLVAGTFADSVQFLTNDPLALTKKLPVKIIVSGTPEISKPDSIAFGDVMIDSKVPTITKEFEIKNTGTANFIITGISQSLASSIKVEVYTKSGDYWIWNLASASGLFPQTVVAKSAMKFRATITPTVPVNLSDILHLTTTLAVPDQSIPIIARIYNPAIAETSQDTITYYAQTSVFKTTHTLNLKNAGGYPLNYKLNIDYTRDTTVATTSVNKSTAPKKSANSATILPEIKTLNILGSGNSLKSSVQATFNQLLSYDTATVPTTFMGYGGSRVFYVGTGFTAPSSGFNLTHVQTWYAPGDWLNSRVGVEIYGGDANINNCKLLSSELFDHSVTSSDQVGSLLTYKLSQNIQFFPNEKFYVVFVYESAVTYPQGCATVVNKIPNRYVFGSGDGTWYDLSEYAQFSTIGWFVRAAEETASSTPWVILSSADSSSIAPTNSDNLLIDFDATNAKNGDNFAKLKISSNDIKNPVKDVVLHLRKNRGPVFDPSDKLAVTENATLNFTLKATDIEGDDFTVALDSVNPLLQIISVTKRIENKGFGFVPIVKTVNLQYKPDYTCQGDNKFGITSTDTYGNKENIIVSINVKNVNRPPVALAIDTLKLSTTGDYVMVYPNDVFSDPDNDIQSISAVVDNSGTVNLFNSGTDYLIMPLAVGQTFITFVATDAFGETAINVVQVKVSTSATTGFEGLKTNQELNLYPNPTSDILYMNIPENFIHSNNEIGVSVINEMGMVVKQQVIYKNSPSYPMDLSDLPKGVYMIRVSGNNISKTSKIIKN